MLTSKDLMIGDWYAFRGHPYKCTASDIEALAECEEKGVPPSMFDLERVAERFYNLALADVRREVEKELKHSRDSQAFSNRESRENGVDYYNSGSIDTLMKLEDFIDNLTK